jgi:hypothetical protein
MCIYYKLSIHNPEILNLKCSKIQNFLNAARMLKKFWILEDLGFQLLG